MTGEKFPTSSSLESIRVFLRSAEMRLRLWGLLETVLWVAALGCVVLLLGVGARALRDFWAFSPPAYAALAAALGVWAFLRLAWAGVCRIADDQVAFRIEQRHPELNNALISSVQLTSRGGTGEDDPSAASASLLRALLRRTAEAVRHLDPAEAVDRSRLRRPLQAAGLMAALTLAVGLTGPGSLAGSWELLLHPIEQMPVRAVLIETEPSAGKILLGRPVTLRATASGRRTDALWVEITPEGGVPKAVEMTREGEGRFLHRTGPVQASFSYRAFIGRETSRTHRLEAVPPPAVGEIEVGYTYPRYAGLKPEVRKGSGYVRALKGTEVALSLRTNKPVESGRLVFRSGAEVPLDVSDPERPGGRFIVMDPDAYRIVLRDRWGFENPDPVAYSVDLVPDHPPAVEWVQPQGDLTVNGGETIAVHYLARDDFGLEDVRLVVEVSGAGRREFTVSKLGGAGRWESGQYDWDLRDLGLRPGAVVRARLVVRDNDAISGPKEGASKTVQIRVRNPEEEHRRVRDQQKNIADQLVNLLADQLELEADTAERLGEPPDGLPGGKKERELGASREGDRRGKGSERLSKRDAQALRQKAEKVEETVRNLVRQIDQTLSRVGRDPRSGFDAFADMSALRSNLSYLQREMMPQARKPLEDVGGPEDRAGAPGEGPSPQEPQGAFEPGRPGRGMEALRRFQGGQKEVTREMERMAVFADDIGKRGRLRDLANLGEHLARAQNRMLDAFDRAKTGDSEAQRALREALDKVRDLLSKLSQALQSLPVQLPEEFMNLPTDQMMNVGDLSQKLQEIQRRLSAGDLEGARKLAEDLVKGLSQMIAALHGALQQAMSQAAGQFGQSVQRQQSVLQELLNRQRALLAETRKIEGPMRDKFRQMQEEAFRRSQKMAERAVETLQGLGRKLQSPPGPSPSWMEFPGEKEAGVLSRSLSRREIPEAVDAASQLRDLSRKLAEGKEGEEAASAFRGLGEDFAALSTALENLPKDPRVVLGPEERERLGSLQKEQKGVEAKTTEVRERLERVMRLMPFLSPEIAQNLRQAGDAMGKSAAELGDRRADASVPHQQDAIHWLSRAGSGMRNAMQQMGRRGRFGGAPAPSVLQPGGSPMVVFERRPNVGEEEGGQMGASTRDFRLPDKDAYKVPKTYREEVVEALKGKYPPAYREQIEQYFKNLVE
ncbi:MAG: DUF4175 family protein [Candidatus Tectomicrobia bacterium]|nr:DUF4175 family protein [Candidatus Tectomicrobia bacterium]